jgi:uncharacterized protein YjdB
VPGDQVLLAEQRCQRAIPPRGNTYNPLQSALHDHYLTTDSDMSHASNSLTTPLRYLLRSAAATLVLAGIACGGGSDMTGPGGGGPAPVASIDVSASSTALLVGVVDSTTLGVSTATATVKDASGNTLSGRTVSWTSSATDVATVSSTGVIKAVGIGTANIIGSSGGKQDQISVNVTRPGVARIGGVPATISLAVGATDTLTVTLYGALEHVLTGWIIATVNNSPNTLTVASGRVTGIAAGTGTVTFSADTVTTTTVVTVTP